MLIDWDLSKEIKDDDERPRQHSRTGTWQFISISRLLVPLARPHEVSDDLESFFWVLLYQVAKCRDSRGHGLEEQMRNVFDQHTEMDRKGNVTGGKGKLLCLSRNWELNERTVKKLVKTPCRQIIEELRALLHDFYLFTRAVPDLSGDSDSDDPSVHEDERDRGLRMRVQEAAKKLSSSERILEIINERLSAKWDVDDDGSLHKTLLRPESAASRNRRKRKAAVGNEESMTFNQRRKGRLPPRSIAPSRKSLLSQGTYPQSRDATLLGSSSHGATRVSTRSQTLRSQSRGTGSNRAKPKGRRR